MKNGIEVRSNGVMINKLSNGMYKVMGGCFWSYVKLKSARRYADSIKPGESND